MPEGDNNQASEALNTFSTDGLTEKRLAFIEAYVGEAKFNATAAAKAAGYGSPHAQGWQLLREEPVKAEIKRRLEANAMSAEEVLSRLADMARADINDFVSDDGRVDMAAIRKAGLGHCVKEYSFQRGRGMSIKLHDSQAALTQLGKVHALFVDRREVTGKDGGPVRTEHSLDESLRGMMVDYIAGEKEDQGG